MKKIFIILLLTTVTSFAYVRYPTHLVENIKVDGYDSFNYVFWLHPGQANRELHTLFTQPILDFLRNIIPPASNVIDIGAHTGDTSVLYALVTGKSGKVIAFEPNPSCFEVLQQNAVHHPQIIPVKKAVTERAGDYTFYYTDPGLCNGAYADMLSIHPYTVPVKVEGIHLEEWLCENTPELISNISFIKIDTEGYDRFIIKSIAQLLRTHRPIIQCELFIYLNAQEKAELFTILDELNYVVILGAYEGTIDTSCLKSRQPFNKEQFSNCHLPQNSIDFLCIPIEKYARMMTKSEAAR